MPSSRDFDEIKKLVNGDSGFMVLFQRFARQSMLSDPTHDKKTHYRRALNGLAAYNRQLGGVSTNQGNFKTVHNWILNGCK